MMAVQKRPRDEIPAILTVSVRNYYFLNTPLAWRDVTAISKTKYRYFFLSLLNVEVAEVYEITDEHSYSWIRSYQSSGRDSCEG